MAGKLEGKVVAVTGSGRGIGRGIALLMAKEGAKVVVNDIFKDPAGLHAADQTAAEINKAGGAAVANHDSVATMAGGESLINAAIESFGRIDILVNVAGNFWRKPTLDLTEEEWDSIIGVHLKGHFACIKAALPHMVRQNGGRIVNFASRAAFSPNVGNLAYCAAKGGIMGLNAKLAEELKEYNITVNTILPSAVTQLSPNPKKVARDRMPMYQNPHPDDVAPIVCYLATDEAKNITGQFIYAASGDVCVYVHPLRLHAANVFVRKPNGRWTIDELGDVLQPLMGLD